MVVHWETSLKSLYVRTVWIDGRRHAILSKDDPVANSICPIVTPVSRHSRGSTPESTMSTSSSQYSDLTLNANPLNLSNIRTNYNYYKHETLHKTEKNYNVLQSKNDEYISQEKNPLSERVLQWLDLAGRDNLDLGIDNLDIEYIKSCDKYNTEMNDSRRNSTNSENIENNSRRLKKSAQKFNRKFNKNKESKFNEDGTRYVCSGYLFHAPAVSNDILNYAKKSLLTNQDSTESETTMHQMKATIPSSVITFENDDTRNASKNKMNIFNNKASRGRDKRPQTSSVTHLRHKMEEGENDGECVESFKKQSAFAGKCFESQYLEMVRKRISENSFNMRATRRQLHIFIPSLPKQTVCDSSASSIITIDD